MLCRKQPNSHNGQLADNESDKDSEGIIHKSVGMQADSKHVHTEPGKTRHHIAEHGQHSDSTFTSISTPASVKNDRVPQDNCQRAVLLRIPAPKATPRLIGPDSAKNSANQTEERRETNHAVNHPAERLRSVLVKRA